MVVRSDVYRILFLVMFFVSTTIELFRFFFDKEINLKNAMVGGVLIEENVSRVKGHFVVIVNSRMES